VKVNRETEALKSASEIYAPQISELQNDFRAHAPDNTTGNSAHQNPADHLDQDKQRQNQERLDAKNCSGKQPCEKVE
jgi:hypothetical protein